MKFNSEGWISVIEIVNAMEINTYGVFKEELAARHFNKKIGDILSLQPVRTTLSLKHYQEEIFCDGNDGAYLEACVGKGNVHVQVTKTPFLAVRAISGGYSDRNREITKKTSNEERGIFKTTSLLSFEEVIRLAVAPAGFVTVSGFGRVDEKNIQEFKACYMECYNTPKGYIPMDYVMEAVLHDPTAYV